MADPIFSNPRLASIYDCFDGERSDLIHYLKLAKELGAKSVLDIGCGTGCLATLLSEHGLNVTGLDPAVASLKIAKTKPFADKVQWIAGDVSALPELNVDLVVMTGNVAQVFTTDELWEQTLSAIRQSLSENGHLVFETRNPAKKAWMDWTPENTYKKRLIADQGQVETWCEVTQVKDQLISFKWTYRFESDNLTLTSDSTLRFREKQEIVGSLLEAGFSVKDIRDAPDRPGKEFVFIASVE